MGEPICLIARPKKNYKNLRSDQLWFRDQRVPEQNDEESEKIEILGKIRIEHLFLSDSCEVT